MASGTPEQALARALGAARVGSGSAFIARPRPLGRLLVGEDADGAGAQLFISAFGARDALLGAGNLLAADGRARRSWLVAAGLADAFDVAATAVLWRRLPPGRRELAFTVSALPAVVNLATAARLGSEGEEGSRPGAVWRWMYRGEGPNRVARFLNGGWRLVGLAGLWPGRLNTLEVRGRRSGGIVSFPVMVADHEGERYLVSMLGERANWVANVRAAAGEATLRHGTQEPIHLEEVAPEQRGPILRRYLEIAPGARPHIPVDRRAPLEEFERIAADYPTFRVRPAGAAQPS
jgi:hypothetical protein